MRSPIPALLGGLALLPAPGPDVAPRAVAADSVYEQDVEFALDELQRHCGDLLRAKGVDWRKVEREFARLAEDVESDAQHLVLLTRLLARVQDGHARVVPLEKGQDVRWPADDGEGERKGAGMFWCRSGKRILVKNAWSDAAEVGVEAGMEVLAVDGVKVGKWLDQRIAEIRDLQSFSTDQAAFYNACHWGLAHPVGTRLKLELRTLDGKKKTRTVTCRSAGYVPWGPPFFPEGLEQGANRFSFGRTPSGFGYIHLREIPGELPEQLDGALAALGDVPGLVLDFRANGGGGCDHDAVLGRFVPVGHELRGLDGPPIASAGPRPYGGPIVVIVDAGARSAGETASGMFKEDGRAYMIGESPTAGSSGAKTTIELPSRLFGLYVVTRSHRSGFNGGRGIEGVGVEPHELVEYDASDLAEGRDTLLLRAEALLRDFPQDEVPYDPARNGWKPSGG